ncbi:MAG: M23 family metallopeptidase [Bacteroidota bacterium]
MRYLLFFLLSISLFAQQKAVTVTTEKSGQGADTRVTFTANNLTPGQKVLVMNLRGGSYSGAGATTSVTELSFGANRLFSLNKVTATPGYRYRWYGGCLNVEPDFVLYLLPFAAGKTARIQEMEHLDKTINGKAPPENWTAYAMTAVAGDTVFAARRGTVIEVVAHREAPRSNRLNFARAVNYLVVEHADCTRAKYAMFAREGIFPVVGSEVEAGDPLGTLMDGQNFSTGTHLRFMVYYPVLDRKKLLKEQQREGPAEWAYVRPKFAGVGFISETGNYTAEHPRDVIFQEMSKRQIKRWTKLRKQ